MSKFISLPSQFQKLSQNFERKEKNVIFRPFVRTWNIGLGLVMPWPSLLALLHSYVAVSYSEKKKEGLSLLNSHTHTHKRAQNWVFVCDCMTEWLRERVWTFLKRSFLKPKHGHENALDTYQNLPQGFRTQVIAIKRTKTGFSLNSLLILSPLTTSNEKQCLNLKKNCHFSSKLFLLLFL